MTRGEALVPAPWRRSVGGRRGRLAAMLLAALAALLATACVKAGARATAPASGAADLALVPALAVAPRGLRVRGVVAADDPTVLGARLLPASLDEARFWAAEPAGHERAIVAGVRLVVAPDGTLAAADERFPATPASVVPLPERLGGGFLFAVNRAQGPVQGSLWRADRWLGPAVPIYASTLPIGPVLVGLDRVYLRFPQGRLAALDPRSGARLDLGPLPPSPRFGRVLALDAWRALVVADLRGTLVTADAGSTWRLVALPIEPTEVLAADDAFAVSDASPPQPPEASRRSPWWRVRRDGQIEPLGPMAPPSTFVGRPLQDPAGSGAARRDAAARTFGARPLLAAIEDGWPLADGTAIVARDGALGRVRLADGVLLEAVSDAFPLATSRCHPISLARPGDPGAFAFVCGEARGATRVYAWNAGQGALRELRRFDDPRQVTGCGNGALVVSGPCDGRENADGDAAARSWCVMSPGGAWSEVRWPASGERAQLVVLADGRQIVLTPPQRGALESARVAVRAERVASDPPDASLGGAPVHFAALHPDVARVLAFGTWMAGFEERRPGVLGGWIEAGGSVLGVEIGADGEARAGEYIRDAGEVVVSGRWGLGWTASRRGFATVDGGMTWSKDSLPDRIAEPSVGRSRACGPIGCVIAGWLRIGWGADTASSRELPPAHGAAGARPLRPWHLRCEPLAARAPQPEPPASGASDADRRATLTLPIAALGGVPGTVSAFPPFSGRPGPPMPPDAVGLTVEANSGLARVYAWGPSRGDWDTSGRWQVRWDWPWGGWSDARTSAAAPVPWPSIEASRRALGVSGGSIAWAIVPGDDADHALLVARHGGAPPQAAEIVVLESERPPQPVRSETGEPVTELESAVRAGGRWYFATAALAPEPPAIVLWEIDGGRARELRRIPRAGIDARAEGRPRLARRDDGRSLGVVVDGQPDLALPASRWVVPVDLESRTAGDPEPLVALNAQSSLRLCTGDDAGWELGIDYPGAVDIESGDGWSAPLQNPVALVRLSREHACVERLLGAVNPYGAAPPAALVGRGADVSGRGTVRTLDVSVFSAGARYPVRCAVPGA